MAELAAIKHKTALDRFVRNFRQTLWLVIVLNQLGQGIRLGAGFLLICGFLHIFVYRLPISAAVVGALLPIGYMLFNAVKKKPGMADAACYADRLLDAKSLLTTAAETLNRSDPGNSEFSPLIIRQAADSINIWQKQLELHPIRPPQPFPWPALAVALLGGFLILQPGKTVNMALSGAVKNQSATLLSESDPIMPNPLRAAIRKQQTPASIELLAENIADEPDHASQPISNLQPVRNDAQSLAAANQTKDPVNANNQMHRPKGQRGIGSEADLNPEVNIPSKNIDMTVKLLETRLGAGDAVSNAKAGLAMQNDRSPDAKKFSRQSTVAASASASSTYAANYSFSQQHFVAAFFRQSHSQQ